MYVRICVELDVSKPMLDTIFVGTSNQGWFQWIEYEGNNAYCTFCGLLEHVVGHYRKKEQIQGKYKEITHKSSATPVTILKQGGETSTHNAKQILRETGLISKDLSTSRGAHDDV